MPKIYDYLCEICGFTHEAIIYHESDDKLKCPVCESEMIRLMPAPLWKWTAGCRGF